MSEVKLYPHQVAEYQATEGFEHIALYHDMGLGKTFTGSECMMRFDSDVNLVICQLSKLEDWYNHFNDYYSDECLIFNLRDPKQFTEFITYKGVNMIVGIINYDIVWRKEELMKLVNFTLMIDESSSLKNRKSKRSKFIISLHYAHVILLSGTPVDGKYEKLWSQLHMLGWKISEKLFFDTYVEWEWEDTSEGFWKRKVTGYKMVDRLKSKMRDYGCRFLKTSDVLDLPEQTFIKTYVKPSKEYFKMASTGVCDIDKDTELIGDTPTTKRLYMRMLCGVYSKAKLNTLHDLLESTADRVIIFYNFKAEKKMLVELVESLERPLSYIDGDVKDLANHRNYGDTIILIQYQAGAMGQNLQESNKIVYFSPPDRSELYEQSKKRTHRIGQEHPCFYWNLIVKNSIEQRIYDNLEKLRDYTDELFKEDFV